MTSSSGVAAAQRSLDAAEEELRRQADSGAVQIHLDHGTFPAGQSSERNPPAGSTSYPRQPTPEPGYQRASMHTELLNEDSAKAGVSFRGLTGATFLLLLVGLLLCLVSFGAVGWSKASVDDGKVMQGLWEKCECSKESNPGEDWFVASQVLISMGLALYIVAVALVVVWLCACMQCCRRRARVLIYLIIGVCFAAGALLLTGQLVFGVFESAEATLAWAYFVSVASSMAVGAVGAMAIMQRCRGDSGGRYS